MIIDECQRPYFRWGRSTAEELLMMTTMICFVRLATAKKSRQPCQLFYLQYISLHIPSIWITALRISRFVLGVSTASKVADASSGTAA